MSDVLTDCMKKIDIKQKGKHKNQQTQTLISSSMIDQMNQDLGNKAIEIIDDVHSTAGIRTDRLKKG